MFKNLWISLRPAQWVKNLFLVLPLVFGKQLFVFPANAKVAVGVLLFSMVTGAVYVINDIFDLEQDKKHSATRLRPLASGQWGVREAWKAAGSLAAIGLVLSFLLDLAFGGVVTVYLASALVYSKVLKAIVIVDVFCLGLFFLLRIVAGSVLAQVELTHWIIFMIVLLALFLGFVKRRGENYQNNDKPRYPLVFLDQAITVLASSIVVVYMLYAVDRRTVSQVGSDHLVFSIPFVCYGVFRCLYLVHQGSSTHDPTQMFWTDLPTQANLLLWLITCLGVIYFGW